MRFHLTLAICLLACGGETDPADAGRPDAAAPVDAGPRQPLDYGDDASWLCRPGMSGDECLGADLSATEMLADGTTRVAPHVVAVDPAYDCFYVYPTVAIAGRVGNVEQSVLSDHGPMLDPLLSQAARFTAQCRVFAPLYRQITLATFARSDADRFLENAYVDIEAAFAHYLEVAGDRPFVIMGHSQGTHMTRLLVQRVIAPDAALRARMIAALLIGGGVTVAPGSTTGGSFDDIPICTADDEIGCVIAFPTFAEGFEPAGAVTPNLACANPAALAGGEGRFAGAFLPISTNEPEFSVNADWDPSITTPFVLFADLYAGECVIDADGRSYLELRVRPDAADVRENPVPFDHVLFSPNFLGLHVLDYDFPLADLMRVVAIKAEAMGL